MKAKTGTISEKILEALRGVYDPAQGKDIILLNMVSGLQVSPQGEAVFVLTVAPELGARMEGLRQEAERAALSVQGVRKASVVLTAEKPAVNDPHGMAKNPPLVLPIRHIIAVASGKGGVGKSTLAVNLAAVMARSGLKTGLLDADIYGPSVPLLTGLGNDKPETKNKKLVPLAAHGLKIMSIGFMVEKGTPLIWRGPMVQTALYQMFRDVEWGTDEDKLDYLIVDLPPGTGDVQLTIAQKIPVTGAVIISTPQDVALIDAAKAVAMFRRTNVPVLGLVENMSTYVCSNCGHEEHIFGHGGAKAEAENLGVPYLGAIPLSKMVRVRSDEGMPIVLAAPDSEEARAYAGIAERVISAVQGG